MTDLRAIQRHLGVPADGILGPQTLAAIAKALGMDSERRRTLQEPKAFFAAVRKITDLLSQQQVDTINLMLTEAAHWPVGWVAYGMATAHWESDFEPVLERGGQDYLFRMYDIQGARPAKARELGNLRPGDGVKYAGRGLVQITGKANYHNAGVALGLDLVGNPELALDPEIAAKILVWGMETGAFTGKRLADYIGDRGTLGAFVSARRIVNGTDRAQHIGELAVKFQDALDAGRWL